MAAASPTVTTTAPSTFTLPAWATYIALTVLLLFGVVGSYAMKLFPATVGDLTGGVSLVALVSFAAHDLENEGAPTGFPRWTTFLVVTIASGAMAAVGSFTGQTLVTVGGFLTWALLLLGFAYHAVAQDAGANVSQNAEVWFLSVVGVAMSLMIWYLAGATDGVAGLVATLVAVVPTWFHITAGSITPTPQPNPPAA